jgi:hypothetical protein
LRKKLVKIQQANEKRLKTYIKDGGEDTYYLDGKAFAYNEMIEEFDEFLRLHGQ